MFGGGRESVRRRWSMEIELLFLIERRDNRYIFDRGFLLGRLRGIGQAFRGRWLIIDYIFEIVATERGECRPMLKINIERTLGGPLSLLPNHFTREASKRVSLNATPQPPHRESIYNSILLPVTTHEPQIRSHLPQLPYTTFAFLQHRSCINCIALHCIHSITSLHHAYRD